MPTYEYTCRSCGHTFEIVQSMNDEPLTVCPECGGELRKVFAAPAISFKGSGFYATDHGKKGKKPAETSADTSSGTPSDKPAGTPTGGKGSSKKDGGHKDPATAAPSKPSSGSGGSSDSGSGGSSSSSNSGGEGKSGS